MKRTMAVILLACASTLSQAQWSGQAQPVETYRWGTSVPPRHHRPCPACGTTTANPFNGHALHAVLGGAIDAQTAGCCRQPVTVMATLTRTTTADTFPRSKPRRSSQP